MLGPLPNYHARNCDEIVLERPKSRAVQGAKDSRAAAPKPAGRYVARGALKRRLSVAHTRRPSLS